MQHEPESTEPIPTSENKLDFPIQTSLRLNWYLPQYLDCNAGIRDETRKHAPSLAGAPAVDSELY
jgi:hypothetical protein